MNYQFQYQYAFVDKTGAVIIDASEYQGVGSFSDGLANVWLENKGWGFIDKTGKIVIEPQFEQALGFTEGLAGIQIEGLWGFVDKKGRIVIQSQFAQVNSFAEGIAVVVKAAPTSESRIPFEGRSVRLVKRQLVISTPKPTENGVDGDRGTTEVLLIDKQGQTVVSFNANKIHLSVESARFSEGLIDAFHGEKKKNGFVNKSGKFVIEPRYVNAAPFSEGLAKVSVVEDGEEKIGFIDHGGRFVIPPKFNADADFQRNSTSFSEGLASLTENLRPTITKRKKFAYLNKNGEIALFTEFSWAGPFRDHIALVYDGREDKWGFIDRSGQLIIPLRYDIAYDFSEGLALVASLY